jgi:hypothetical protein
MHNQVKFFHPSEVHGLGAHGYAARGESPGKFVKSEEIRKKKGPVLRPALKSLGEDA